MPPMIVNPIRCREYALVQYDEQGEPFGLIIDGVQYRVKRAKRLRSARGHTVQTLVNYSERSFVLRAWWAIRARANDLGVPLDAADSIEFTTEQLRDDVRRVESLIKQHVMQEGGRLWPLPSAS